MDIMTEAMATTAKETIPKMAKPKKSRWMTNDILDLLKKDNRQITEASKNTRQSRERLRQNVRKQKKRGST